jgi:type VI secretion system secreted protein VgrG
MGKSNIRRFTLTVHDLPSTALTVVEFEAIEKISQPYTFSILIVSTRDDLAILDKEATFGIRGIDARGARYTYHGAIARCEYHHSLGEHFFYRVTMEPRIVRLARTRHSDVYLDEETIPEMISRVVHNDGAAHAITGLDVDIRTTGTGYRKRSFIYRHEEPCLSFISRHLEHEGMYYYFRQDKDREVMVITDDKVSHEIAARSLVYRRTRSDGTPDDTIDTFVMQETCLPASVILKESNFRKSTLDLTATHPVSKTGTGDVTLYGENYRVPEEGKRYARIRAEEIGCRGRTFFGSGSAAGITSGTMVNIEGHDRKNFNGEYLVVSVNHSGSQAGAVLMTHEGKQDHYTVSFTCIPASIQYRPERITPVPVISGSLTAVIDADGSGSYAELDDHGRYKVSFPFKAKKMGSRTWAWMRMATPYAGNEEGMHFHLRKGTEVLLTFINGHPDNPVISSAVPNSEKRSVVTNRNATTHALQTSAANGLFMTASGATILGEAPSGQNTGQQNPSIRNEEFLWTKYVTGDEQNIIKGSSVTAYLNNRLTLNGGSNVTVNALNMETNINAGTSMNLNLAPSSTYQVADTLTTGPGRAYSGLKRYKTVGLDRIEFVAGVSGAERTRCLMGWNAITFAAATLLGMAASIVPAVYNHFSPEKRLEPKHQAIGAYAANSLAFLFYWVQSRAFDGFDMDIAKNWRGVPIDYTPHIPNKHGGAVMTMNETGITFIGSRKISEDRHLTGAETEGARPYIMLGNGDVMLHAEEGELGGGDFNISSIDMHPGRVIIGGGVEGHQICLDPLIAQISYVPWDFRLDDQGIKFGQLEAVQTGESNGHCLFRMNDNALEAFSRVVMIGAVGANAVFNAEGATIRSGDQFLRVAGDGVSITGRQLNFDADHLIHWG